MLGAPALVRRNNVFVAVILSNRFPKVIEVLASGVRFVTKHQARPLVIAHGAGAAVGQQVDVHILGAEQKGVVPGFGYALLTILSGRHADRLNHFYFPGLGPRSSCWFRVWHKASLLCMTGTAMVTRFCKMKNV